MPTHSRGRNKAAQETKCCTTTRKLTPVVSKASKDFRIVEWQNIEGACQAIPSQVSKQDYSSDYAEEVLPRQQNQEEESEVEKEEANEPESLTTPSEDSSVVPPSGSDSDSGL